MKTLLTSLLVILTVASFAFDMVKDGKANATIIMPANATYADNYAKDELIKFVKEITGATLPVSETITKSNNIFVGQASSDLVLKGQFDWNSLKRDGILIKASDKNLILAGDNSGSIYAVYTFLEDYCGVKYILPEEDYIPKSKNISCPDLDIKFVSPFFSRETNWEANMESPEYSLKLKLNGFWNNVDEKLGGHVVLTGFCHTFNNLMSSKKYGAAHPEWFAERDGKRKVDETSQPCLTNKEMRKEFIKNVLETMANNPNDKIISCTQNDNFNFCTCPECAKMAEQYGQSGLMIDFVNEVAAAVKDVYPDKFVETFAYQYTRPLPKGGIKPLDNVIVRLCSIECDYARPFDSGTNKAFYDDLVGWASLAKNLFIWDYSPNYSNYVIVHPNFHVQQKNMQILAKNHAVAVFNEGDYENRNSCLSHYKRYIISKLLWDPNLNMEKESKDFFKAYYGNAWLPMYNFMKELDRPFRGNEKDFMSIYMTSNPYYTKEDWVFGFKKLNNALDAAKKQGDKYYNRVLFDYVCYEAGYILSSKDIKKEVESAKVIRFTKDEMLKILNDFVKKGEMKSFRERCDFETGIYGVNQSENGQAPDICKDLKDSEWADYPVNTWMIYPDCVQWVTKVEDGKSCNGKAYGFTPKYKNWYAEKYMTNLIAVEGYKTGDIYISFRVDGGKEHKRCIVAGVYNHTIAKDMFSWTGYADATPNGNYVTEKVGTIDLENFDPGLYFWIGGVEDETPCDRTYVDRFFVVFNK